MNARPSATYTLIALVMLLAWLGASHAAAIAKEANTAIGPADQNQRAVPRQADNGEEDEYSEEEDDEEEAQQQLLLNRIQLSQAAQTEDSNEEEEEDEEDNDDDYELFRRRKRRDVAATDILPLPPAEQEATAESPVVDAAPAAGNSESGAGEKQEVAQATPTPSAAVGPISDPSAVLVLIRDAIKKVTTRLPQTQQLTTSALQYFQLFEHFLQQTIEQAIGDDDDDDNDNDVEEEETPASTLSPDVDAAAEDVIKAPEEQVTPSASPAAPPATVTVGSTEGHRQPEPVAAPATETTAIEEPMPSIEEPKPAIEEPKPAIEEPKPSVEAAAIEAAATNKI